MGFFTVESVFCFSIAKANTELRMAFGDLSVITYGDENI